jgi:hypothetical protein
VPISSGHTLVLTGLLEEEARTHTFVITKNQKFALEGVVAERDNFPDTAKVFYGGVEGVQAKLDGGDTSRYAIFTGAELASQSIVDVRFDLSNSFVATLYARYTVN